MSKAVRSISIDAYDYPLPDARIARHPLAERSDSKLLVYRDGQISDHVFHALPEVLPSNAHLLLNETRVLPVRLFFQKSTGGGLELFLLEPTDQPMEQALQAQGRCRWKALVRGLKKWKDGPLTMQVPMHNQVVNVTAQRQGRQAEAVIIDFTWEGECSWSSILEAAGKIPLPPYLGREPEASDEERYQTVFSRVDGSVAAPTASLHFDEGVFAALKSHGYSWSEVVLHVGAGTFKPVEADVIGDHHMHQEAVCWSLEQLQALSTKSSQPLIAVGTTALRSVESLYWLGVDGMKSQEWEDEPVVGQWSPYHQAADRPRFPEVLQWLIDQMIRRNQEVLSFRTGLLIAPGYAFEAIDGLITNFHQPRSTLLLLVAALIGPEWEAVYTHALDKGYRFLSYGDGSLLMR